MKFRCIKKIIRKLYHLIWFLSLFLIFILPTNASVVSYQFFGKYVGDTFSIPANSSSTGRTYFNVTGDSTRNYLVVDICSTTHLDSSVPNDYDGSYSTFVKEYDTKTSCTVSSYNGSLIRLFYYIRTWADSGNGNMAFNNNTSLTNLFSWNGVYKIVSVGLSDDMDVGDLVVNNQNIIINSINNIQGSINSSSSSINGNINSSSSSINGNINQKSQDIINNQNQTSGSIIINQNENTEKQIDSQKVCNTTLIDNSSGIVDGYLNSGGSVASYNLYTTTDYISLTSSSSLTVISSYNASDYRRICFYDNSKSLINCIVANTLSDGQQVSIPSNTSYARFTINKSENTPKYNLVTCKNGNQALNDSLTDDSAPDLDLEINYASDTPISDLLTMPLTILNALLTNLSDSCVNYNLPFLFDTTVTFPCFTISDYLGTNLTNYIDLFICFYMCYNIALLCINVFEDITSLRDNFESLYEPRHADTGYKPRHARGGVN